MTILKNNRLQINIEQPGTVYNRSRFDWTGFISQITLDEKITYCVPEHYSAGKGTGGIGFCNEFGIDKPIGYDNLEIGETFPKIGVGNVKKTKDEAYDFFKDYDVEPCDIQEKLIDEQTYVVISKIENKNGFTIELTKKIQLAENRLSISYFLQNRGQKDFLTNEYCHNFIGINDVNADNNRYVLKKLKKAINTDQRLLIPSANNMNLMVGQCQIVGDEITWKTTPKEDFYVVVDLKETKDTFNWEYFDEKLCAGVRDYSKIPISKCAVWGTEHVVSPELFIQLDLKAGEVREWSREYEFFQVSDTEGDKNE